MRSGVWAPPHPKPSKPKQKNKTSQKCKKYWKTNMFSTFATLPSTPKRTTKTQNTQEHTKTQKHTKAPHIQPPQTKHATKNQTQKPPFCINKVHFLQFCGNLHPFSAKTVLCWKHDKNIFSAEHSFCGSEIANSLLETLFAQKGDFWYLFCACWGPNYCSVLCFCCKNQKNNFVPNR